jgi:hypothetical protein
MPRASDMQKAERINRALGSTGESTFSASFCLRA